VAKFRKKPVVIEAIQFTGDNSAEVLAFTGEQARSQNFGLRPGLIIHTLEGDHAAGVGDFIIKGIAGEFYPCKPDIFAATYEAV